MLEDSEEENGLLIAHDSGNFGRNTNTVEIYVQDGDGNIRSLVASGRPCMTINRCDGHFIAHGVCIDCTQHTGRTVWAS